LSGGETMNDDAFERAGGDTHSPASAMERPEGAAERAV